MATAALLPAEREQNRDARIALIHSGANVDAGILAGVLGEPG